MRFHVGDDLAVLGEELGLLQLFTLVGYIEKIVVSALGGMLGILLGVAAAKLIETFGTSTVVSATPMILAFSCAAATGLVFGYAPARKAARLDPVEALGSE